MSTPTDDGKGSGRASSLGEMQGRLLLSKRLPQTLVLEDSSIELPPVDAPSLEGLSVALPELPPVSGADIYERFEELRREVAPRRELAPGEPVAQGNEALLDVVGHALGQLLPFSARTGWWALVRPDPLLPGFFEALVGERVGTRKEITVMLPPGYPVEALREVPARFTVEVKAARELRVPEEESPECFALLGRGATLEEVMQRIRKELLDERVAEVRSNVREHVLDLLVERTEVEVPPALVDEEIRRQWMAAEQPALQHWKLPPNELQHALESWLWTPRTRRETERRLKIALVLGAIAARDKIQPGAREVEEFMKSMAGMAQVPPEKWKQVLESNPAMALRAHNLLLQQATLNHVMSKVAITAK
jgi:trigger factor